MAWHSIVTKGNLGILLSKKYSELFPIGHRSFLFLFFFVLFHQRDWDWADTPYVHDAHSTWLFRMQQISNVFLSLTILPCSWYFGHVRSGIVKWKIW